MKNFPSQLDERFICYAAHDKAGTTSVFAVVCLSIPGWIDIFLSRQGLATRRNGGKAPAALFFLLNEFKGLLDEPTVEISTLEDELKKKLENEPTIFDSISPIWASPTEEPLPLSVAGRPRPTYSPATQKKLSEFFAGFKSAGVDFLMVEAKENGYLPEPPKGFRAYRNSKKRVFLQINPDGSTPSPQDWVEGKNCITHPL